MADILSHGFAIFFQLHHACQTLHEELNCIHKCLLKLLVMADKGEQLLAKLSSCSRCQVNTFPDFGRVVDWLVCHDLVERVDKGVERICTIHFRFWWQLAHERNTMSSQQLELVDEFSRLLIPYLELIHLERFPGIYFLHWSHGPGWDLTWPLCLLRCWRREPLRSFSTATLCRLSSIRSRSC